MIVIPTVLIQSKLVELIYEINDSQSMIKTDSKYHKNRKNKLNKEYLFSEEQCEQLFQAVLVHDDIYLDATLPDEIYLDYSQQQLEQCYMISRQIWYQGVDRKEIAAIGQKISKNRMLSKEDKLIFKYIRARFKHLRFAYFSCNKHHHYPSVFHLLIVLMGSIQDAITNDHAATLNRDLLLLKIFLNKYIYSFIFREIETFQPCTSESFVRYISREMDFLKFHLNKEGVSGKEFHEMRKAISRLVALYDNLKILFPSSYHNAVSKFLSTLNGLMGAAHDELIVIKLQNAKLYFKETFHIDDQIRIRLEALTEAYS